MQTALRYLSNTTFDPAAVDLFENELANPQELQDDADYRTALEADVVMSARQLVTACRASGQRRDDFARTIRDGNSHGGWGEEAEALRVVTLLRDMEVRWSTSFLMIDCVLELAPVSLVHFEVKMIIS